MVAALVAMIRATQATTTHHGRRTQRRARVFTRGVSWAPAARVAGVGNQHYGRTGRLPAALRRPRLPPAGAGPAACAPRAAGAVGLPPGAPAPADRARAGPRGAVRAPRAAGPGPRGRRRAAVGGPRRALRARRRGRGRADAALPRPAAHRGEVALPGGRSEPGEAPWDDRAARGERGGRPRPGRRRPGRAPQRALDDLAPARTSCRSSATLAGAPTLVADPREVDRAFSVSLADLAADGAFLEEHWSRDEPHPGADDEGFFPVQFF